MTSLSSSFRRKFESSPMTLTSFPSAILSFVYWSTSIQTRTDPLVRWLTKCSSHTHTRANLPCLIRRKWHALSSKSVLLYLTIASRRMSNKRDRRASQERKKKNVEIFIVGVCSSVVSFSLSFTPSLLPLELPVCVCMCNDTSQLERATKAISGKRWWMTIWFSLVVLLEKKTHESLNITD